MRVNVRIAIPLITIFMTGCTQHGDDSISGDVSGARKSVLATMRPGADPALIDRLTQEEKLRAQAQAQQISNGQLPIQGGFLNGLGRVLPRVSTDPIAPPAEQVAQTGAVVEPDDGGAKVESARDSIAAAPTQQVSSYPSWTGSAVPPPPPGALAAGLVPPPVPVTLSTQAQTYGGPGAEMAYNPYANPYFNPYGVAPPQMQMPAAPQERPAGLFGSGRAGAAEADAGEGTSRRQVAFTPISPTGMDNRSPFKQRDDLKVLWKGALNQSIYLGALVNDSKTLTQLNRVQVGLPNDSTKGTFNLSARQLDAVFRSGGIDKKVFPAVRRLESELVQSYYRYLYTYNKYCFAQQTVAARKQEVDLANSASEQQRATADLSQAQTDAEGAKEDMRSAQVELAQASSPSAARAVITKVSGVAPNMEALSQAEPKERNSSNKIAMFGSMFNPIGSIFKMGHGKPEAKHEEQSAGDSSSQSNDGAEVTEAKTSEKSEKGKKSKKEKIASEKSDKPKLKIVRPDDRPDLTPAPADDASPASQEASSASIKVSAHENTAVSFMLKGVNVTARKSVLTVAIKNGGADAFNFSPDLISVADGSRKLSDAATRADFDTTLVQPNEEVNGTITIFGRPWSDKLTVCICDGSKAIQMRR